MDLTIKTEDGTSNFVSPESAVIKAEETIPDDGTNGTGNLANSIEIGEEQDGQNNIGRTYECSTDVLSSDECVLSSANRAIRACSNSPEPTVFVKVENEVMSEGGYDCIDNAANFAGNEKDAIEVIKREGVEIVSTTVSPLPICVPTVSDLGVENDVIIKKEGLDASEEAETIFGDNNLFFSRNMLSECDRSYQSATSCDKRGESSVTELFVEGNSDSLPVEESQVFRAHENSSPSCVDTSVPPIYVKSNLTRTVFEESYTCTHCRSAFKNASRLDQHVRMHFSEKPFACSLCPARFKRKYYLLDHLRIHAEEKLTCTECPAKFSKKSELKRHLNTHALNMPYSCPDCSARFQWKSKLRNHRLIHSNVKPYLCAHCPAAYKRKSDVKFHLATQHTFTTIVDRPLTCPHCFAKFRWKKTLRKHLKTHNTSVIVTMKGDQTLGMLDANSAETPLSTEYPASSCSIQGTTAEKEKDPRTSEAPVAHDILFSEQKVRTSCDKPFQSASFYNEVSSSVCLPSSSSDAFDKPSGNVQKSSVDSGVSATAADDMKNSSSEKPFRCTDCCAEFKTWGYLQIHSIVHKDERPFICAHCSTKFKRRSDLKNHLRTHTNAKPFTCMFCPAKFRIASSLKLHLRTHNTTRPHACSECPAKFKESRSLQSHLKIHSNERPVVCTL